MLETVAGRISRFYMRHNRRFWKRDKIADFKMRLNRQFCKREQSAIKIVSLIEWSWPSY